MLLARDGGGGGASADVKWRDNGGMTAFHAAAAAGQISVLGLLLESLDDENAVQTLVDNEGYVSPLVMFEQSRYSIIRFA